MKKFKIFFIFLLLGSAIYVYARGGGSKNTGGGGTSNTPPNWTSTTISEGWAYASLPANTSCGSYWPQTSGNNTCPTITSQTIYNSNNIYYSKIIVEDLEMTVDNRREYCRNFSNTTIEIPYNHKYRITYDFLEKCTNCMSPGLIPLTGSDGRRIWWQARQEFAKYTTWPYVYPRYNGLKTCS